MPQDVINCLWSACHVVFGINGKLTICPQPLLNNTVPCQKIKELVGCKYSAALLNELSYVFILTSRTGEGDPEGEDDGSLNCNQNQEAAYLINKLVYEWIENLRGKGVLDRGDDGAGVFVTAAPPKVENWSRMDDYEAVTAYESHLPRCATDPKWKLTHKAWLPAVDDDQMHTLKVFRSHLLQMESSKFCNATDARVRELMKQEDKMPKVALSPKGASAWQTVQQKALSAVCLKLQNVLFKVLLSACVMAGNGKMTGDNTSSAGTLMEKGGQPVDTKSP